MCINIQLQTFNEVYSWPWRPRQVLVDRRRRRNHEDRVRYWLTDAEGEGQPIPDKVFMVMSRPKSKVYYCFIKLSGIFLQQVCHIHSYCIFIAPAAVSLAWLKIETSNRPLNAVFGVLTLRYTRVNAVSANQRRAKSGEIPDHLIIYYDTWNFVLIFLHLCE